MGKPDPWFDSLYENNADKLFRAANGMLHDRERAKELVQDTFLVLVVKRESVEKYKYPNAFLWEVMRKRIGNEMQKSSHKLEESLEALPDWVAAAEPTVERVEDILPKWLNQKERQMLIWRLDEKLSWAEIAQRLGISVHACEGRMNRLREKFKKHYRRK